MRDDALFVGLDIGSSGVRAVALDADRQQVAQASTALPPPQRQGLRSTQDPQLWWQASTTVLGQLLRQIEPLRVVALAVDGTSGTLLLTDAQGRPLSSGWMYNDASCTAQAQRIAQQAPPSSACHGSSSPLARLLYLQEQLPQAALVLHQADWLVGQLSGLWGVSDENNALKLGYDPLLRQWPDWLDALDVRRHWLPQVHPPGTALGRIAPAVAAALGLSPQVQLAAGSTDGVAAFLATGAQRLGDAVTSLGTTLVVKVLSAKPVCDPAHGIYSHRLGGLWLPGGASNTGGAALLQFFSPEAMARLTPLLQPAQPTGLDYYPLPRPGERFPHHNPTLQSRTTPRPADDARFFQGLLEGMAQIEKQAFDCIQQLGAPYPQRLFTVGGGAANPAWSHIRQRVLGVPAARALHQEAACGAAMLALRSVHPTL